MDERQTARAQTVLRNTAVSVVSKVLLIVAGFVMQRVTADALGKAMLGLSSVLLNVISLLSLADMGITSAIMYHLYAPLVKRDGASVAALMRQYAKYYRVITLLVAACGLVVATFVQVFLRENGYPLAYVRLIYLLYLVKAVLSYFVACRRSLLIADQKVYVASLVEMVTQLLITAAGVLILTLTRDYVAYLASAIGITLASNVALWLITRRLYPYLGKPAPELPPDVKRSVLSSAKNVFVVRLSSVVPASTDSIIISAFIGTAMAGVYNGYAQIVIGLNMLVTAVTNAVQPTLGRLFVTENRRTLLDTLSGYTFVFFLGASFAGVSLLCLATPFVTDVWLTPEYELAFPAVALLAFNFFLMTLRCPLWSMMDVSGLFARNRNISLAGAALNLAVSLALVGPLGVCGVFAGTLVAQVAQVLLKTRALCGASLGLSARSFLGELLAYVGVFAAEAVLAWLLCTLAPGGALGFALKAAVCLAVSPGTNLLLFCRTKRYQTLKSLALQLRGRRASS